MKRIAIFTLAGLLLAWMRIGGFADEPQFKTRAIWIDPSGISSPSAVNRMLDRCARAGINLILPNVMYDETVSFKSSHFKARVAASDQFDPLACVISKAHAAGIKVQPWCCVYYHGGYQPAWLARSIAGKPLAGDFLSPSNPEVNPYLLSVIKDLLAYDIDGIHLDYIRYPGTAFDYSDAGRKAFRASGGFDPQDFLDHAERIVPAEQERFPVRVLYPITFADQIWELTAIERTLDQAGIGFAYVSEAAENLAKLRVPGLLIISSCYQVSPEMLPAIQSYVARGGSILWTDAPATSLANSSELQKLTGLAAAHWIGPRRIALQAATNDPLARALSQKPFRTDSLYGLRPQGAAVIARLDTGEPVMTLKATGKGQVLVLGFHLMKSTSPVVASLAKEIVDWLKTDAGVTGPDLLGQKRAEWVAWRGGRVTQLVRDISRAAKEKDPGLLISSSGGPSPWEFYACYRDARRWLAEGINDQLFPMNYTPDPAMLSDLLDVQTASTPAGRINRVFPGLQLYAPRMVDGNRVVRPIDAATVEQELRLVQERGYQGFCLFAYRYLSDEIIDVVRKFGEQTK